jgi:hypothetical protein
VEPFHECTEETCDHLLDVNLKSVFLAMREEIKAMLADGGGAIVDTSSVGGLIGNYGLAPCIAAKHGVIGLTKAAAFEYGQQNLRVNAVAPGSTATEMFLGGMEHAPAEIVAKFNSFSPMNRLGQPLEIATAAAWLLSGRASFVTGATLPVDGGFLLACPFAARHIRTGVSGHFRTMPSAPDPREAAGSGSHGSRGGARRTWFTATVSPTVSGPRVRTARLLRRRPGALSGGRRPPRMCQPRGGPVSMSTPHARATLTRSGASDHGRRNNPGGAPSGPQPGPNRPEASKPAAAPTGSPAPPHTTRSGAPDGHRDAE